MRNKLFILLFINEAAALLLSPCGTDSTLEVVSGKNSVAVCSGVAGQTMAWRYVIPGDSIGLGECSAVNNCQSTYPAEYILNRSSDAEGTLTFMTTQTLNGNITCQIIQSNVQSEITCFIDTVIPAEGSCIVEFRRNTTPWSVFSQCNITRAYSARDRYRCQWFQIYKTTQETMLGSSVNVTHLRQIGDKNFAGSCVLPATALMSPNEGSYSYKVNLTPGRNNVTATFIGTNEIVKPIPPIMNCSNKEFVPENTNITCYCETLNIGKPGGRLKWFRLYETQQPILVNAGNYDIKSLEMVPQTLNRNDDGRTQLRCDVEWAETITGGVISVRVGYIELSTITINKSRENLTVMENQAVTFTCTADGRPTPSMNLTDKDKGTLIRKDTSPLTHTLPSARCEDTSTYSCFASNGMGKDTTSAANLYVNCTPRLRSFPLFKLEVRQKQTASSQFDIIAYPTPNNFTFTFIGLTMVENKSSSDLRGLILNATCRERQELYISDCTITAFNNNSDGGVYMVTVANAHGSVNVTFEVTVNGTSTPNPDNALPVGAAVGIGIAVAVLVLAAAVVIVFLVWRRRKGPKKDKSSLHDRKALYADNGNSNVLDNNSLKSNQCQTNPSFSLGEDLSGTNQHFSSSPSADKNISVNTNASSLAPVGTTSKETEGYKGLPLMMQPPVREARSHHKQGKKRKEEQNKKKNKKQIKNTKETEYENVPGHEMKKLNQAKKEQGGLQNTAEGLTYMELDFSRNQPKKESHAAPVHETVEYAPIDFSRQPPNLQ